jgi:hypothetical protein
LTDNSESRTKFNIGFLIEDETCNLNDIDTKSFEIILPNQLNLEEIEKLRKIEKMPLIQSLRQEKNILKKSYSNVFSYACEEI